MQLTAWLPGNTECDRFQCACRQISTVKHSLLCIVSTSLVVFPMPHFQFCTHFSFFQMNEFLSTSVSYFFYTTHIHYQCWLFCQFYNFFVISSLSRSFDNLRIDEPTTGIFSPRQKCITFTVSSLTTLQYL
jgi:hypothetical protein